MKGDDEDKQADDDARTVHQATANGYDTFNCKSKRPEEEAKRKSWPIRRYEPGNCKRKRVTICRFQKANNFLNSKVTNTMTRSNDSFALAKIQAFSQRVQLNATWNKMRR
jgi:hypothetical protein